MSETRKQKKVRSLNPIFEKLGTPGKKAIQHGESIIRNVEKRKRKQFRNDKK